MRQYFSVRHAFPGNLYRFYSKSSIVMWPAAADFAAPRPASAPVQALEQCTGPTAIDAKARRASAAARALRCENHDGTRHGHDSSRVDALRCRSRHPLPRAPQVTAMCLDALVTDVRSVDSAPTADGGVMVLVTGVLTNRADTSACAGTAGDAAPASSPRGALSSPTSAAAAAAAAAARAFSQTFFLAPQESGFYVAVDIMRFIAAPPVTTPAARPEVAVPMPISLAELSLADAAAAAAAAASPASPGTPPQMSAQGSAGRGHMGGDYGGAATTHAGMQQQQQQQQHWGGHHAAQQASYDASAYGPYAAMQAEHARAYGLAAAYGPYAAYYAGGAHPAQMGLPPMRHERSGGRSRAPPAYAPSAAFGGGGDDTTSIFVRRLPSDVTPEHIEEGASPRAAYFVVACSGSC